MSTRFQWFQALRIRSKAINRGALTYFILKQLPVLPPDRYSRADIDFIAPRVLELTYTAWDLQPFAEDMCKELGIGIGSRQSGIGNRAESEPDSPKSGNRESAVGSRTESEPHSPLPPFTWNPDRRAHLRAELDAYYAHLYGLTRDELRYILDPSDIHGPDFPSETFRVLKNNEIKQYGEYRTQRLVLEAWDKLGF